VLESFSVSFSVLGLLPSVASTIGYSLGYSGTGGALWGWLIAALAIQATAFTMAELCSSMPTAGGLYYAAAVLAPEGWGPLCSWIVGWSNFFGFATGPCSVNYALASMLVRHFYSRSCLLELTCSPGDQRCDRLPRVHSADLAYLPDPTCSAGNSGCSHNAVYQVHWMGQ